MADEYTAIPVFGYPRAKRPTSGGFYGPTWSPDSRYIAFMQVDDTTRFLNDERGSGTNVYLADSGTGEVKQLSNFEDRNNKYPTWSLNSQFVAFVSSIVPNNGDATAPATPYTELWVANIDSNQMYPLAENVSWATQLTWLPIATLTEK